MSRTRRLVAPKDTSAREVPISMQQHVMLNAMHAEIVAADQRLSIAVDAILAGHGVAARVGGVNLTGAPDAPTLTYHV